MKTETGTTKTMQVHTDEHSTTVRIVGELDMLTTVGAATAIVRLRTTPPQALHIDATDATFIDSSGISALALLALAVRKRRGTVTMQASPAVRRVVDLCGIGDHLGMEALADEPMPGCNTLPR